MSKVLVIELLSQILIKRSSQLKVALVRTRGRRDNWICWIWILAVILHVIFCVCWSWSGLEWLKLHTTNWILEMQSINYRSACCGSCLFATLRDKWQEWGRWKLLSSLQCRGGSGRHSQRIYAQTFWYHLLAFLCVRIKLGQG